MLHLQADNSSGEQTMRCKAIGPARPKIALVGEAPSAEEEAAGIPFAGKSGHLLKKLLQSAGINFNDCLVTNVFFDRPKGNKVEEFFTNKKLGVKNLPVSGRGKYLKPEFAYEIERLKNELLLATPNIVIALGATAAWALLGDGKISSIRGFIASSTLIPGLKVLPTYHPAAVLRQWDLWPIVHSDFIKALRESETFEIRRPERRIWIDPDFSDMEVFYATYLLPAKQISYDIETRAGQITCIGFSPDPTIALVVPFHDARKPGQSYWATPEEEIRAWEFVRRVLTLPCPKVAHNGMYDIQYLWKTAGIPVRNARHDTMILHHTLQPELPKSLGFLGSVYTNEAAWKGMREKEEDEDKPEE